MSEAEDSSNHPINASPENGVEIDEVNGKDSSQKQRIIDAFIDRAKDVGARAVSTDEIARVLSISKKTLYKQFSSKELIVKAVLDNWAQVVQQPVEFKAGDNPKQVLLKSTAEWRDNEELFCTKFWEDAGEDYPALRQQYYDTMFERMRPVSKQLRAYRKPNLDDALVREVYYILVMKITDKSFFNNISLTPKEALLQIVELWLDGCFNLPEVYQP